MKPTSLHQNLLSNSLTLVTEVSGGIRINSALFDLLSATLKKDIFFLRIFFSDQFLNLTGNCSM